MQKTKFPFEVLVHEDASTDNTAEVLRAYQKKYPEILKVVYQTENQYLKQNSLTNILFVQSQGEYIATCEGDDFWIDPLKLQKQVDFLDQNQDFQVVFTNTNIVDSNNVVIKEKNIEDSNKSVFTHLDMPIFAPTLTRLIRNNNLAYLNELDFVVDETQLVYQSKFGKVKFLDEVTASYRKHNQGEWSGLKAEQQLNFKIKTLYSSIIVSENALKPKLFGIIYKNLAHAFKANLKSSNALLKETYWVYTQNKTNLSFNSKFKIACLHRLLKYKLVSKRYIFYTFSKRLFSSLINLKH